MINLASAALGDSSDGAGLDDIEADARRLVSFHPGDARLYSVVGEIARRMGARSEAKAAFALALALTPTELHALEWTILSTLEGQDSAKLLDLVDILFRRWPERISAYAPALPSIFGSSEAYDGLVSRLETVPPWRRTVISRLAAGPDTVLFADRLLRDLASETQPADPGEIRNVLSGLVNGAHFGQAYATFLLTLSPAQRALAGNVYNGRFLVAPTGNPFDWMVRSHPGVAFSFPGTVPGSGQAGLNIEFLHAPVRDLSVRQYLYLPAGRFSLSFSASAHGAVLPKGLFWTVRCATYRTLLSQVTLEGGSYRAREKRKIFDVPPVKCPMQVLQLATKAVTGSWNDRYLGSIAFDDFKIVGEPS